jgi:membrane peptidoglycan carboxypeptidase
MPPAGLVFFAMAVRSSPRPVRRSPPQPAGFGPRKKRFRGLRRLLVLASVVAVLFIGVRAYVLQVYAPGLESEASSVPAAVQAELGGRGASYTSLQAISPTMRHAIVSIEDRRFYQHHGVDPIGLVRAMWVNLTQQQMDQGGSTLEEQLAKRAIVGNDRSIHAKLRTLALAWAIDQDYPKWKILELYLNDAYYGQGAYGIQQAARTYFGTDAASLSVGQAAFLAAMPQAPSIYGAHPRSPAVLYRWKAVLQSMESQGYITAAQEQAASDSPLTFALPNPG